MVRRGSQVSGAGLQWGGGAPLDSAAARARRDRCGFQCAPGAQNQVRPSKCAFGVLLRLLQSCESTRSARVLGRGRLHCSRGLLDPGDLEKGRQQLRVLFRVFASRRLVWLSAGCRCSQRTEGVRLRAGSGRRQWRIPGGCRAWIGPTVLRVTRKHTRGNHICQAGALRLLLNCLWLGGEWPVSERGS